MDNSESKILAEYEKAKKWDKYEKSIFYSWSTFFVYIYGYDHNFSNYFEFK